MQQYNIKGKRVTIHNDGYLYINGNSVGIKQWKSDKKRYSNLSGTEQKELRNLDIQTALELKGFL